jgi:hypothetical protein
LFVNGASAAQTPITETAPKQTTITITEKLITSVKPIAQDDIQRSQMLVEKISFSPLTSPDIDSNSSEESATQTNAHSLKSLAKDSNLMKRLVFCGLSVLVMSVAIAPSVKAETVETTAANSTALSNTPSSSERLTPFNLVQQAYRGSFMAQGIPNYRTLSAACQSGRINGTHLIQAAIDGKKLSSDMVNDRTYLFNVNNMLNAINND